VQLEADTYRGERYRFYSPLSLLTIDATEDSAERGDGCRNIANICAETQLPVGMRGEQ
jgi:hypothetical protein